jgi:hypothetical protein
MVRMQTSKAALTSLVLAVLFSFSCRRIESAAPEADRLAPAVTAEVARVDADLSAQEKKGVAEGFQPLLKMAREAVVAAKGEKTPEMQLARVRVAHVIATTLPFFEAQTAAQKKLGPMEALWNQRRAAFERPVNLARHSALQRGLAEAADTRAQYYFKASLPYARSSGPGDGLYYLAEAEGHLRFRDFILGLPDSARTEELPPLANVRAAFDEVENETLRFFEQDRTSPAAIAVSARLKETRQMLEQKRVAGATLTLLEARRELSKRRGDPAATGTPPPKRNDSIAAWAASAQNPALVSLYDGLFRPASHQLAAVAPVTVTLVRWPFT